MLEAELEGVLAARHEKNQLEIKGLELLNFSVPRQDSSWQQEIFLACQHINKTLPLEIVLSYR